ncbi:hypothetical protein [Sulfurimonas sp.]|uniref:hypothetical protein n=1 Tax=Sulfurimonas sp. TaxID=2022749 RepID=UPI002B486D1C|nr:hypothetical protein [Sulfurimonas sp.]
MINIDKAQKVITDSVTCKLLENNINREGSYLAFDDISFTNQLNIDYHFTLFVVIALFNEDKQKIYKVLNTSLNEVNESDIDLVSCKPYKRDGKLLIYQLKLKVKIIG